MLIWHIPGVLLSEELLLLHYLCVQVGKLDSLGDWFCGEKRKDSLLDQSPFQPVSSGRHPGGADRHRRDVQTEARNSCLFCCEYWCLKLPLEGRDSFHQSLCCTASLSTTFPLLFGWLLQHLRRNVSSVSPAESRQYFPPLHAGSTIIYFMSEEELTLCPLPRARREQSSSVEEAVN